MNKITFKYKNRNVEFYNVPHSLARAFEIILHYIENDSYNDIVSSESEAENNDD